MSRDGTLPPGVEHCDIPGESDEEHHPDCPAQDVTRAFADILTREQLTRYLEPRGYYPSWKDETDDLRESAIGCRKYEVCECDELDKGDREEDEW